MSALPTLYEYYTGGGVTTGLSSAQKYFTLNNRNITLFSGSLQYYRVPKPYWRDRLRKMRAAGLNTVETYIPWNLHEPEINNFDFGHNGSDMEEFLDVVSFLKIAQEEDLLAIVRQGPYINSEWEFGGLPSWLLREKDMEVRTSQPNFMKHVTRYFNVLLPILAALQFTFGGPIIAFQVDNEYGFTKKGLIYDTDRLYLAQLRELNLKNGIVELLVTSDIPVFTGNTGTLSKYFLQTTNFRADPELHLNRLKQLQPNKPLMVMEYWTGWFDHWAEVHHKVSNQKFYGDLDRILRYPASVNLYLFHGGTNWGFHNGANVYLAIGDMNLLYAPDTTSYDYDAPLTEAGDYTDKYYITKELISKYNKVQLKTPSHPANTTKIAYPKISITHQLKLDEIVARIPENFIYPTPVAMEILPINNNSGQSYGYIIYKKSGLDIPARSVLTINGYVWDTVMVVIDGILISKPLTSASDLNGFGYWRLKNSKLNLGADHRTNCTLELIVENYGRNNFGFTPKFRHFKGLWQGDIYINFEKILNWQIIPLQFQRKWTNSLSGWTAFVDHPPTGPALYKTEFIVNDPQDTFIDMRKWTKGIVIINGFVLGRYASPLGPQQTLYLPAPLINNGTNEIIIFEHFVADKEIIFSDKQIYYTPGKIFPFQHVLLFK